MSTFANQVVVVTGGGGGIGGATCRYFAQHGAKVAVFDLNLKAAQDVAKDIQAHGGHAAAFECDITQRNMVDAAVQGAMCWSTTRVGTCSSPSPKHRPMIGADSSPST